jgi:hypothetical protein
MKTGGILFQLMNTTECGIIIYVVDEQENLIGSDAYEWNEMGTVSNC